MSRAEWRTGGQAGGVGAILREAPLELEPVNEPLRLPACPPVRLTCNRCGFPVHSRPWGCKNPCANCGTIYPLGDCSD